MRRYILAGAALVLVIIAVAVILLTGEDELTEADFNGRFSSMLTGEADSIKEIACEAEHETLDGIAFSLSALQGAEVVADTACEFVDDRAVCRIFLTYLTEEPQTTEVIDAFTFDIDDGEICNYQKLAEG